jgi:hypothetical protein
VGGTCGTHGRGERCLQGFGWRPEGKRSLGRPRRRWEDDIKLHLRETGIDVAKWIQLAQDRVQWWAFLNTVMNLRVPLKIFFDKLSDYPFFQIISCTVE